MASSSSTQAGTSSSPMICAVCRKPSSNTCAACRGIQYCSTICQKKDWPEHKKHCSGRSSNARAKAKANPASSDLPFTMSWSDGRELKTQNIGLPYPQHISPYGVVYNRDTKTFEPMSASVKFFDPQFGYSKETAVRVYKDLIDAFKFHRKEVAVDEGVEEDLSPETSTEQFEDFLQRAKERDVFPSWWDQVDDEGVRTFAREDQLRRLDRSYHWTDSRDRSLDSDSNVSQKTLTVAIGTLAERITWDASGTEARIKKAKARPPSQMVVVHQ